MEAQKSRNYRKKFDKFRALCVFRVSVIRRGRRDREFLLYFDLTVACPDWLETVFPQKRILWVCARSENSVQFMHNKRL